MITINIKRYLPVLLALCIGLVSGGVVMVQAHGGDTNLVHACVLKNIGTIRIVAASENCKSFETALDWSKSSQASEVKVTLRYGNTFTNNLYTPEPYYYGPGNTGNDTSIALCNTGEQATGGGVLYQNNMGGGLPGPEPYTSSDGRTGFRYIGPMVWNPSDNPTLNTLPQAYVYCLSQS